MVPERCAHWTDEDFAGWLASPEAAGETTLSLFYAWRLTAASMEALVRSGHLAHFRTLALQGVPIGDRGLEALVGSPDFAGVERLFVGGREITADEARARGKRFPPFSTCEIGEAGLSALAASAHTTGLRELDLSNATGTAEAWRGLFDRPDVARWRSLRIASPGGWADEATCALARRAEGLEKLVLELAVTKSGAGEGDAIASALASGALARVERLSLPINDIGPEGAKALANASGLGALRELDLSQNPLGEAGARALSHRPGLPRLEQLTVWECGLESDEIETWVDWGGCVTGESPRKLSAGEIKERFFAGQPLRIGA